MIAYLDTSALAKWYLNEPFSEQFEDYVRSRPSSDISRLTVVELRSLLARRRRAGDFDKSVERRVLSTFQQDVADGALHVQPIGDERFTDAMALIDRLSRHPLRTLDALHLAIAEGIGADELATADRTMAAAARALGFGVRRFY